MSANDNEGQSVSEASCVEQVNELLQRDICDLLPTIRLSTDDEHKWKDFSKAVSDLMGKESECPDNMHHDVDSPLHQLWLTAQDRYSALPSLLKPSASNSVSNTLTPLAVFSYANVHEPFDIKVGTQMWTREKEAMVLKFTAVNLELSTKYFNTPNSHFRWSKDGKHRSTLKCVRDRLDAASSKLELLSTLWYEQEEPPLAAGTINGRFTVGPNCSLNAYRAGYSE